MPPRPHTETIKFLMIQQVLARLAWKGRLTARNLHALTPLFRAHVNPYGRFELAMGAGLDLSRPEMAARDRGVGSGPCRWLAAATARPPA
jgi:hypothetical protein